MSPHVAAKVTAARRALGDLAAAVTAITAAGQHPLTARCDVAGCRGCPVCAPERREVAR